VETFIPARKKLKHKDAERPQIRGEIVAFVEDYLRSNVLWSPAERPRLATFPDLLGKPEIHLYPATHRRHCSTYRESVQRLLHVIVKKQTVTWVVQDWRKTRGGSKGRGRGGRGPPSKILPLPVPP